MVGDKTTTRLGRIRGFLSPAEAEVGAMAKADQNMHGSCPPYLQLYENL